MSLNDARNALAALGMVLFTAAGPALGAPPVTTTVGPFGHHRQVHRERVPLTPEEYAELRRAGKTPVLDGATGARMVDVIRDQLPADWRMEGSVPAVRTDSQGHPIVNDTPGLPAWAQRDVDALRAAIIEWRDQAGAARRAGGEAGAAEPEGVLANFVGQAITRGIDIDDILDIDTAAAMTPRVAAGVIDYLRFYENIRFVNQDLFGYVYEPTVYPARVDAFVRRHGRALADVQRVEPAIPVAEGRGSLCYATTPFARGMTDLSGAVNIWVGGDVDDAVADIPTGFPMFFFFECQNTANNDVVRVSSNGFITFVQQGGGTVFNDFRNDSIPTAFDPDGFAAPWWDDLVVAANQGTLDRVSYKTEGEIGRRVLTVEWFSVSRFGGSTFEFHFFQVKLYETTDVIELHFANDWFSDPIDDATVGIENLDGTEGRCGPNCSNTIGDIPPSNYRFARPSRPSNDACQTAAEIVSGEQIQRSLRGATTEGVGGCEQGTNRDLWFLHTAGCDGTLRVDTCGSRSLGGPNAGADTVLSLYSGCPASPGNQIACNDDAGIPGCSPADSLVVLPVQAGERTWIRVTHFGTTPAGLGNGSFLLRVVLTPTSLPSNDRCADATVLADGEVATGFLACATSDGVDNCSNTGGHQDIWYRVVAPTSGRLIVSACGSRDNAGPGTGPDTVLTLLTGCPGPGVVELACNDDLGIPECDPFDAIARADVVAGQAVLVRVTVFDVIAFRVGNGVVTISASVRCVADFDRDGRVNSQDFFDFLTDFFRPRFTADINLDGLINSQDFFEFLTAFFGGC